MSSPWKKGTSDRDGNRYDDWNFKQRPGTKGSDELLIPVMMRFDLPQNRTQEDWDEYLQKGLNDIIKLTEDNLRTAIKDPEGSLNNQSLLSGGDLSAFERILKEAKVDVGPNASIRDILGQDGPRSTLAKWLAGQTDATLHYLSIIQVYFTEAFLFEKYEQPNDEEPQHQSPPDERKEETGKEHLEGLGEILFTGQPIALNTFSQFRNGTQGLPRIEPSGDKKVMLGVIDGGFPFLHDRLRHETTGKTLIERLWVQQIDELSIAANFGVSNGVTLTQKNIDKIIDELIRLDDSELTAYALDVRDTLELEAAEPICALNYTKGRYQPLSSWASHGMHVLGTALDAYKAEGAPLDEVMLCLVELPFEVTSDTSGSLLGSYYVQAVRQLMQWADDAQLPLVINMSYGMVAGPKNGRHPAEQAIQKLLEARSAYWRERSATQDLGGDETYLNTSIVLPSGNSKLEHTTISVRLASEPNPPVTWVVLPDDRTSSFLEIWVDAKNGDASNVTLTVKPPGYDQNVPVKLDKPSIKLLQRNGRSVAAIYADPKGLYDDVGEASFFVAVAPTTNFDGNGATAPHGRWEISLQNEGEKPINATLMAQRDDTPLGFPLNGRQSFFEVDDWEVKRRILSNQKAKGQPRIFRSEDVFGVQDPKLKNSPNGNAIASSRDVCSVGAQVNVHGNDNEPIDETWVQSRYASDIMRRVGDPAPDRMACVDRGYLTPGKLGDGTLSGTKLYLSGTSIAAPQVAGIFAAEFVLNSRRGSSV